MTAHWSFRNTLIAIGISAALIVPGATLAATAAADDEEIDDIIVTATRLPRNIMEIDGTVSVITEQDIRDQVASDLDDIVRYQPGISMSSNGRGGNMGFVIRGIGGNRVLTMIDGIRAGDSYSAGPINQGADAFEIDDFKAVEVIRGPASVLYGADAMGGAVIMRTKDPIDYLDSDNDAYVGVRAGYMSSNELAKIGLTGAKQFGDLGFVLQYTNRDYAERDISGGGSLNPLDGVSHGLLLKSVYTPNENHTLRVSLDAMQEDNDFELLSELSGSVTESLAFDEIERFRVSLQHDWSLNTGIADKVESHLFTQTADGLQHTEQQRTSFSFINPMNPMTFGGTAALRVSHFEFNQETSGVGVMLTKTFTAGTSEHALVYGINYDQTETERPRDRVETDLSTGTETRSIVPFPFAGAEDFPNKTFPDTKTKRTGVYVQDEIAFGTSGFTLIPGLRYDNYDLEPTVDGLLDVTAFGGVVESISESHTSANLGVIYDVTDEVALFAQYAEGFRPPNYDEANQAYVQYSFNYVILPNPNLEPETSEGVEVGIKANFDDAFYSFVVYENRYDDFISTDVVGFDNGFLLFQGQNLGKVKITGAEATAIISLNDNWEFNASLAYARGDNEEDDVPLDSVDPFTAVLGMRYTGADEGWFVEPRVTHVADKGRISGPDVATADAYTVVDILGSYNFNDRTSLRVGLFNVTDEEYARWTNIQGIPVTNTEAIANAFEPGFNVRAALNFSF